MEPNEHLDPYPGKIEWIPDPSQPGFYYKEIPGSVFNQAAIIRIPPENRQMITKEKPFLVVNAIFDGFYGPYETEGQANTEAKRRVQGKQTWVVLKALRSFGPKQEIQEEEF